MTFQKQGLAQKRPFDGEDGALGQQQYLTRLRELQSTSETSLVNLPKAVPASGKCANGNSVLTRYSLPFPNFLLYTFDIKTHFLFSVGDLFNTYKVVSIILNIIIS